MNDTSFREGIDRKSLTVLRKRFLRLNRQRLQRMRIAMPEHQRDFSDIVSLAIHQNHPILPGYVSKEVPSGISDYTPGKLAVRAAKRHAKSFVLKKRAHLRREILSVFIMGSSGTIAHSGESDYDIWVCHRKNIDPDAIKLLRKKLDLISEWAKTLGLDAHFFLMDEDYFRDNQSAPMDNEAAGSSQHFLLLDEFYRTAIILAGRAPLWWMVPNEHNDSYKEYAGILLDKRYLRNSDWIDFGPVPDLPVNEFFGAALWQVYKGIDAPYKSVIKIALMEVYASMYPDIIPLSADFKRLVYAEDVEPNRIDPYLMVYRKVEAYLLKKKDFQRLDLIRRCFYIKVNVKVGQTITHGSITWRRELMTELCRQWGWEQDKLLQLDSRKDWKVNRTQTERRDLVRELTNSYKSLSNFARQQSSLKRISEQDINLLGRKLYAAFERRSGKIEFINPNIAPDLYEEFLTFHHHESSSGYHSWLLYKDAVKSEDSKYHTSVKRSTNLVELVVWAYLNGLLNRNTQILLNAGDQVLSLRELKQFCRGLIQHFPQGMLKPADYAFENPAQNLYSMIIVNLGVDPMAELTRRGLHLISNNTDALDYGTQHINLAIQFDLIQLNSWGEITVSTYNQENALTDAMISWLGGLPEQANKKPHLFVQSYSITRPESISRRINELWGNLTNAWFENRENQNLRFVFKLSSRFRMLQAGGHQLFVKTLENENKLIKELGKELNDYSPVVFDSACLVDSPLSLIFKRNKPGIIQLYYYLDHSDALVWIIDENGVLFHQRQYFYDHVSLLNHYLRFFQSIMIRRQAQTGETQNLDFRFYQLRRTKSSGEWQVQRQRNLDETRLSRYFNIQVIASEDLDGKAMFTFYCDDVEISPLEYGEQMLTAVAKLILRHRNLEERYPSYITDLDISALPDYSQGTCGHLRVKKELEDALYEELHRA